MLTDAVNRPANARLARCSIAGIQENDQIIEFNGRKFGQFRPYEVWFAQRIPESAHTLKLRRDEQEFKVTVSDPTLRDIRPPSTSH
jgi:hypothetical protein